MSAQTDTRLGGHAFNHGPSTSASSEYDRLRALARSEQSKHQHWAAEARQAYERGEGARAHEHSQRSHGHEAAAEQANAAASALSLRENNAPGRVAADTLDLHGQYVREAEALVELRVRHARQTGQTHLHLVVGRGKHSPGHVQRLKPCVERVCRDLGVRCHTEQNEGRIYVDLRPEGGAAHGGASHGGASHGGAAAAGYPGAQSHAGWPQEQMQYGGEPGKPEKEGRCCGLCVVM